MTRSIDSMIVNAMKIPALLLALSLPLLAEDHSSASAGVTAAEQFLNSLDAEQRTKAALPFQDDERENFRYVPRNRAGLQLKEMKAAQKQAAMALLDSALSEKGKLKVEQIILLEGILAEMEKNPSYRDDGKYYVTVFGKPDTKEPWGWRFEGHHVSINLTYADGKVISATPSFMGTNPAEVREGKHKGLRVLADEEDLARALVSGLLADDKNEVIFSKQPPREIISGEDREVTALEPVGIPAGEMSETQREGLVALISAYTGRYRADIAKKDMEKIQAAGIEKIRFGWAGGTKPGEAYYFRIQGPTFLMESANVQNNANHIHSTWRDFTGDFGRDILREHYKHHHH